MDRSRRQDDRRAGLGDHLTVFARPRPAAERVADAARLNVLHLVLSFVVLQAQAMSLANDQQLGSVAVRVREPMLLTPGLRDDLHAARWNDRRLGGHRG